MGKIEERIDMTMVSIMTNAIVIVVGSRKDPVAEMTARIPNASHVTEWDLNRPEESADKVRQMVKEGGIVVVAMTHPHPKHGKPILETHSKTRGMISAIARKHGVVSVLIQLPSAPEIDQVGEKIDYLHRIDDISAVDFAIVPMPSDMRHLEGPFDVIGDVHSCAEELIEMLSILGHAEDGNVIPHAEGRVPVLLGDLTDRGPDSYRAIEIAMQITSIGGHVILGNHDYKLMRWLRGANVRVAAGLALTIEHLAETDQEWRNKVADWLDGLQTHLILDQGNLVVAHAGISEELQGRHTSGARSFALYGKPVDGGTTVDEEGYPIAEDWAQNYAGKATVVHGHVVYPEPRIVNNVIAIDTGCVFGGKLTALRWPEREFVQVKAKKMYFESRNSLLVAQD